MELICTRFDPYPGASEEVLLQNLKNCYQRLDDILDEYYAMLISFVRDCKLRISNFEDLPESSLIELKILNTLDLRIFDDEYDGETDFKVHSTFTRRAKSGNCIFGGSSIYQSSLFTERIKFRTEFRSGPGGDWSPENVLPFLKSPDPNRMMVKVIAVQPYPRGGFGIFASKDIAADDLVLVETHMFSFNGDRSGKELCHHGHRKISTVCACEPCQEVYCSDDCRTYAAWTYHASICGTNYKALKAMVMQSDDLGYSDVQRCCRGSLRGVRTPVLSRITDVDVLSESMLTEFEDRSVGNVITISPEMLNNLGAIALCFQVGSGSIKTRIAPQEFSCKCFITSKAVAKGEELTVAYADLTHLDPRNKQEVLKVTYGFEC
eukprot:gene22109-28627_t